MKNKTCNSCKYYKKRPFVQYGICINKNSKRFTYKSSPEFKCKYYKEKENEFKKRNNSSYFE